MNRVIFSSMSLIDAALLDLAPFVYAPANKTVRHPRDEISSVVAGTANVSDIATDIAVIDPRSGSFPSSTDGTPGDGKLLTTWVALSLSAAYADEQLQAVRGEGGGDILVPGPCRGDRDVAALSCVRSFFYYSHNTY